ncbi:MAG: S1 RNA-binding domain-containing protein [Candidatus Anammoximicrobium sp.]|nr:S1 RNA-binding domain-containing protein [Candidatus Anammoximicrobium sp.]
METTIQVELGQVARELALPLEKVQVTVELLDDGNTVPFITRYRKDQTGGLDEDQIRQIQEAVARVRILTDRRQRVLKSLEAAGKLTPDLADRINAADSLRRLEDLYLPFKPKKQTLAGLARSRGLDTLAHEIVAAQSAAANLEVRAADFVNAEKGLPTVADVLQGAGHLIAEMFSENYPVRDELRESIKRTGKLVSARIEETGEAKDEDEEDAVQADGESDEEAEAEAPGQDEETKQEATTESELGGELAAETTEPPAEPVVEETAVATPDAAGDQLAASSPSDLPAEAVASADAEDAPPADASQPAPATEAATEVATEAAAEVAQPAQAGTPAEGVQAGEPASDAPSPLPGAETAAAAGVQPSPPPQAAAGNEPSDAKAKPAPGVGPLAARSVPKLTLKQLAAKSRKEAKQRKREKKIESFKDYFRYQEPLAKIPPHRLLAINRGERSKILRVKVEVDPAALYERAEQRLIRPDHPHAELLRGCLRDALIRLLLPSLEREVRRELTEKAELHAVQVFARNLRQLLLQPPVRDRRVLAVDPGFRSGCKLAALDEFGNVLGHTVIHVIGKDEIVRRGRQQIVEMVLMYHIPVIAIGNGTACRESERLIADIIAHELKDHDVQYVTVNEAGASVYSTSSVGREELPRFDPVLRSAVSIGRRLQDPLSELVKINPANIGVGLYQHDVKSKHLEVSLDAVVESCVNFVGVDVNTASPALLRYVSGLNQLTARRMYEYRQKHGPFRNRDQFRNVPGFGDATFIQAAGFLKIMGGDNPLDATWIHPESYPIAQRVLEQLGGSEAELARQLAGRGKLADAAVRPAFGTGVVEAVQAEPADAEPPAPSELPAPSESAASAAFPEPAAPGEPAASPAAEPSPPAAAEEPVAEPPGAATSEQVAAPGPAEPAGEAEPVPAIAEAAEAVAAAAMPVEPPAPAASAGPPPSVAEADDATAAAPPALSLAERASRADPAALAAELGVGEHLLQDILNSLQRPGRDPREDLPQPAFRRQVMKLEHLQPGMELMGTILNVVDFGAFVDIGLPDSGLIHISRLADRFVKDPHEVVSVGDILNVWVVEVDKQRRRVSLTAIRPGTERPQPERRERPPAAARPERRPEGRPGRAPQGRRYEGRSSQGQRGGERLRVTEVKSRKPKQVRPITDAMVEGKEPMRSFSDLLQFYEKKPGDEEKKKS